LSIANDLCYNGAGLYEHLVPGLLNEQGQIMTSSIIAQAEHYMGLLVANVVNMLDPEVVVLGGGVVERLGERYIEPVRETAEQYYLNQQDKDKVHIVATELGGFAGVLGAAMMASQTWKRAHRKKR
jgi:glucokinase